MKISVMIFAPRRWVGTSRSRLSGPENLRSIRKFFLGIGSVVRVIDDVDQAVTVINIDG